MSVQRPRGRVLLLAVQDRIASSPVLYSSPCPGRAGGDDDTGGVGGDTRVLVNNNPVRDERNNPVKCSSKQQEATSEATQKQLGALKELEARCSQASSGSQFVDTRKWIGMSIPIQGLCLGIMPDT